MSKQREGGSVRRKHESRQVILDGLEARLLLSTIYVDANSPGGTQNGTAWVTAYRDLRPALLKAVSGDVVKVADGVYKSTISRDTPFFVNANVTVVGSYAGYGATFPEVRDVIATPSILSGDMGTVNDYTDNSYNVVKIGGGRLDGFTITGGYANGIGTGQSYGAALYGYGTVLNCRFFGNRSGGDGGAISNTGQLTAIDCIFVGNVSERAFGGAYDAHTGSAFAEAMFINCTFANNSAHYGGGAISGGHSLIYNCVIWNNTSVDGSQVYLFGGNSAAVAFTDIHGGWSGTGNISADPQFLRNPDPGVDGTWGTSDDDYGDLRIPAYSPVVDAGRNSDVPGDIITDLAGENRFTDIATQADSGNGTVPIVDMGAFEAAPGLFAEAGGPYYAPQGADLPLRGQGASIDEGSLLFEWDFDGDEQYDDATGSDPVFPSSNLPLFSTVTIGLRVTDALNRSTFDTATLMVIPPVIYVDDSATGMNDGTSWSDAYTDLQTALLTAIPGQRIHVAQGTYKPTAGSDRDASFVLRNGVSIFGGFAGVGAAHPDERDLKRYNSILSGEVGLRDRLSDNTRNVVIARLVDSSAVLEGVIITSGYAGSGGGLLCGNSQAVIRNCTFAANFAQASGGGVYALRTSLTLINCVFVGNVSVGSLVFRSPIGGAIYAYGSTLNVLNCTFSANGATTGPVAEYYYTTAAFTNCIIWGNGPSPIQPRSGSGTTVSYTNIEGGYSGVGNNDVDPEFLRSPSSGPDSTWGTADDDFGDLRLLLSSPCIDTGNNSAVPMGVTTDRLDDPRFVDVPGVNSAGAVEDRGAFEYQVPLVVVFGELRLDTPVPVIVLTFNGDLGPAQVPVCILSLLNLTRGDGVNYATQGTVHYDASARSLRWTFGAGLPDGNYRAILPSGSVLDAGGSPLAQSHQFDFFVLVGDANKDRKVDLYDLTVLATNWQGTGKTFSEGDFNYDGTVNSADLGILATKWQARLDPPPAPAPPIPTGSATRGPARNPTRVIGLVI